jgi:hypothetical protein
MGAKAKRLKIKPAIDSGRIAKETQSKFIMA